MPPVAFRRLRSCSCVSLCERRLKHLCIGFFFFCSIKISPQTIKSFCTCARLRPSLWRHVSVKHQLRPAFQRFRLDMFPAALTFLTRPEHAIYITPSCTPPNPAPTTPLLHPPPPVVAGAPPFIHPPPPPAPPLPRSLDHRRPTVTNQAPDKRAAEVGTQISARRVKLLGKIESCQEPGLVPAVRRRGCRQQINKTKVLERCKFEATAEPPHPAPPTTTVIVPQHPISSPKKAPIVSSQSQE